MIKTWAEIVLLVGKLYVAAKKIFKAAKWQEEHDELEKDPGRYLHDQFSDGMRDEDANDAAKAALRERIRSD